MLTTTVCHLTGSQRTVEAALTEASHCIRQRRRGLQASGQTLRGITNSVPVACLIQESKPVVLDGHSRTTEDGG